MGMSIDKAIAKIWHCIVSIRDCVGNKEFVEALELSVDIMRKYQQLQTDYETRLKADMVAMLTEIQLEIREYHEIGCDEDCNNCRMVGCVEPVNVIKDLDIIQQKIDALKGGQA